MTAVFRLIWMIIVGANLVFAPTFDSPPGDHKDRPYKMVDRGSEPPLVAVLAALVDVRQRALARSLKAQALVEQVSTIEAGI